MNGCPYLSYDGWNGDYDCEHPDKEGVCDTCEYGVPLTDSGIDPIEIDLDDLFGEGASNG